MPVLNAEKLIENRVEAIREYHKQTGIERAQLDVSGGVDSAVMLGLLAKALGPEKITAVYTGIHSSKASRQRAEEVAATFNIDLIAMELTELVGSLADRLISEASNLAYKRERDKRNLNKAVSSKEDVYRLVEKDPTIMGSFRSTIRAPIGRFMNRLMGNGIRHGTGNECEDRWLRFYQKGGDGEVDTNPIAMLSKGEVFQLAIALGVPRSILEATPSPDLQGVGDKHNDEDELKSLYGVGWTYSKVDPDTGEYTYVGTIEKMSRFLDLKFETSNAPGFHDRISGMIAFAVRRIFNMGMEEFSKYEASCNDIERVTRHKMNPNCPTLGSREQLVWDGIITNELPNV